MRAVVFVFLSILGAVTFAWVAHASGAGFEGRAEIPNGSLGGRRETIPLPLPPDLLAHFDCLKVLRQSVVDNHFRQIMVVASLPDQELSGRIDSAASAIATSSPEIAPPMIEVAEIDFDVRSLDEARTLLTAEMIHVADHTAYLTTLAGQARRLTKAGRALGKVLERRNAISTFATAPPTEWPSVDQSLELIFQPSICALPLVAQKFAKERRELRARFEMLAFYSDTVQVFLAIDRGTLSIRPDSEMSYQDACPQNAPTRVAGTDCGSLANRLLFPYYSRREDTVAMWASSTTVQSEVKSFFAAVNSAVSITTKKTSELLAARNGHVQIVLPSLERLRSQLSVEGAHLASFRTELDIENGLLETLRLNIGAEHQTTAALKRALAKSQATADTATEGLRQNERDIVSARATVNAARVAQQSAKAVLDDIVIECGGVSYVHCNDQNAKDAYNKRTYEAYDALGKARGDLFSAQNELLSLLDKHTELIEKRVRALNMLTAHRSSLMSQTIRANALSDQYKQRSNIFSQREALNTRITNGHEADSNAIEWAIAAASLRP